MDSKSHNEMDNSGDEGLGSGSSNNSTPKKSLSSLKIDDMKQYNRDRMNSTVSGSNDYGHTDSLGMLHEIIEPTHSNNHDSNTPDGSNFNVKTFSPSDKDDLLLDHRPTLEAIKLSKKPAATEPPSNPFRSRKNSSINPRGKEIHGEGSRKPDRFDFSDMRNFKNNNFENIKKLKSNYEIERRKTIADGDVVIDVDALMRNVKADNLNKKHKGESALSNSSTSSSDNKTLNSRPSSRRSSHSSSLDDVCLVLDAESELGKKDWPDVEILEEFSKEETERLRRQAIEDAEEFHFNYDEEDDDDDEEYGNSGSDGIFFSKPIVTSIDVPELGNRRVNEADSMKSGGLRPKRIAPWHLKRAAMLNNNYLNKRHSRQNQQRTYSGLSYVESNVSPDANEPDDTVPILSTDTRDSFLGEHNIQYPPHIISNNLEHFRFTYFRVDLESTVHSPTISGLLQAGQKFEDLFVSSSYSHNHESASPDKSLNGNTNTSIQTGSSKMSGGTVSNNNKANASSQPVSQIYKTTSRLSSTITEDITEKEEDVVPFWLDVLNPTEEEMKVLSKAFGIHPLTTEDIFLGEAREKVELFKDYYLVCFRSFDIVAEKFTRKKKEKQSQDLNNENLSEFDGMYKTSSKEKTSKFDKWMPSFLRRRRRSSNFKTVSSSSTNSSYSHSRRERVKEEQKKYKRKSGDRSKPRHGELEPLNVYIIVFKTGVLTFHFAPTPHPINVRRRARILQDYLNVTSDWIAYALIDDITDAFGPMIELIEDEVYAIEDAILKMNRSDDSSDDSSSSDDSDSSSSTDSEHDALLPNVRSKRKGDYDSILFNKRERKFMRRKSSMSRYSSHSSSTSTSSSRSIKTTSTGGSSLNANIIGWKRKGDMLRRIGECRKRVMSITRLLGSKADVIKSFSKRCNEHWDVAPRSEIGMYLGDIQDHIITMVSSLTHYEKLLSRSHSNYLAQINIDMTKVNNDMNDVLGKITILGTVVLPMNVITGLWGMNVLVPGQENPSLVWFMSILTLLIVLAYFAYIYTKKRFGF
ncbi:hypothetical protein TPHA_0N01480 [Tetrapisispora phaffii CBS 4417]|uniref:Manganese resistance protein MNR2 n=1 Tax=Tetrapisispora phaffii (strain ATCC 24235 / CBS 4417 / NBRC 1672 / NRRL Y-8282 / UCD 70-5) TaxID=1071381 RepID=G8C1A1_TETPH|nr:hypothetical protein TPHA_0N01480 [Tetrapisispora phaffii CBS 4417]CCE65929.1 hypothetical protein TPHA_0N01480 [Tetrapisispora phaffii CBS 4417]